MKNKLVAFLFAFFIIGSALAGGNDGKYTFTLDLTKVENDKLKIELSAPKIAESEIVYYLPKMIPGTYMIQDYGRFVSELKAFDKKGVELEVNRLDDNSWKISKANKLVKLTYWIEDIIDSELEGPDIYPMATTNFQEGKNFIINTPGFFGYFEGMKNLPIELNIIRPDNFYGSTGLIPTNKLSAELTKEMKKAASDIKVDSYSVENYERLIDSPIMYSEPDTAILKVANTEVLISAYSPNKIINAREIAATVEKVLIAQNEYLGGKLPVDKYAFIFYFTDQPIAMFGALEHSYSSFYYMPENTVEALNGTLKRFAAHEFFHIVTPLNIHSEEIQFFDFNDPKMSKHLWLYEGMTENFANNVQVKYDLMSEEQYLQTMRQKMVSASNYYDTVAFTDISKFALDKYADQYNNVYEKGALIGMCLDILLRDLSDGKYGTQNLIADLSNKYGKDQAFKDDELFSVITAMTYPEVGEFLNKYVGGNSPLPYAELLEKVGVLYQAEEKFMDVDLGISDQSLGYNPKEAALFVKNKEALSAFGKALGFENGDILKQVNGQDMPPVGPQLGAFIGARQAELIVGNPFSYTVMRDGQEVKLETTVVEIEKSRLHKVAFDENASERQLKIRKSWLKP